MPEVEAHDERLGMARPVFKVGNYALRALTCFQLLARLNNGVAVGESIVLAVNDVNGEILQLVSDVLLCKLRV